MDREKVVKAARIIVKSGMLPFPITETLIEIMELLYEEEELDFIINSFKRKPSQTMPELIKSSKMSEEDILKNINSLASKGAIFNQPSSNGVMVYRILPLIMVGIFEYTFMKVVEHTERELKIAKLFEKLFEEVRDAIQDRYDMMSKMFETIPPTDRTVPILINTDGKELDIEINESIEVSPDKILPSQEVTSIVDKFEDIAVAYCFCRQHQELLDNSCNQEPPAESCFTFGKSARFVVENGFGRMISKDEAKEILKNCIVAGLVHKAYHPHGDINKEETSLCNCCKDCCGTFGLWKGGTVPMVNATNYLADTIKDLCTGCGTCVEKCPVDAIKIGDDGKAERNEAWCIGCGICAHFCPESAIKMLEGPRIVYVPPPKLRQ